MPVTNKVKSKQAHGLLQILILAGIVILVAVVFLLKNQPQETAVPVDESAEAQLDRYLLEGRPTFAFFHSNNCHSCIVMMETVAQVYPEFQDSIGLVDVDVYDPENGMLLERAGIRTIPTLAFINRKGEGLVAMGVMEAGELRQQLTALKEMP
jgi:thiol:disulfide interchange protein